MLSVDEFLKIRPTYDIKFIFNNYVMGTHNGRPFAKNMDDPTTGPFTMTLADYAYYQQLGRHLTQAEYKTWAAKLDGVPLVKRR